MSFVMVGGGEREWGYISNVFTNNRGWGGGRKL